MLVMVMFFLAGFGKAWLRNVPFLSNTSKLLIFWYKKSENTPNSVTIIVVNCLYYVTIN